MIIVVLNLIQFSWHRQHCLVPCNQLLRRRFAAYLLKLKLVHKVLSCCVLGSESACTQVIVKFLFVFTRFASSSCLMIIMLQLTSWCALCKLVKLHHLLLIQGNRLWRRDVELTHSLLLLGAHWWKRIRRLLPLKLSWSWRIERSLLLRFWWNNFFFFLHLVFNYFDFDLVVGVI